MSAWDFLDKAADVYSNVTTAKINANAASQAAQAQIDEQAAATVASKQAASRKSSQTVIWLAVGAAVIVGAVLLLRK